MSVSTAKSTVPAVEPTTQTGEPFDTRGQTVVACKVGYNYRPQNPDLPVVTPGGVTMTGDQADSIIDEADSIQPGLVFRYNKEG